MYLKRIIIVIFCTTSLLTTWAQGHKRMWNDVDQAIRSDLPTTAIQLLHKIKDLSQTEHDKPQELKAYIRLYHQYEKVAVDSASQCLVDMERHLAAEDDAVMRVLWHQALMKIYADRRADTASISAARRHGKASLLPFDELGQTSLLPYQDLFERGSGDAYFSQDLLSPIAREVLRQNRVVDPDQRPLLYARLINYYRNKGNREATLLWTLDSIKHAPISYEVLPENPKFSALCQVAEEFCDLPLNAQTYLQFLSFTYLPQTAQRDSIVMAKVEEGLRLYRRSNVAKLQKKHLAELQLAQVEISGMPQVLYPDEMAHFVVEGKNMKRAELRLYRLGINAAQVHQLRKGEVQWKQYRQGHPTIYNIKTPTLPPYQVQSDTLHVSVSEPGIYECALHVNGKWEKSDIMHISRVRPLWINVEKDSVRVVLLDARSGKDLYRNGSS